MPWWAWVLLAGGYLIAFVAGRTWRQTKLEKAVYDADDAFFEIRLIHRRVVSASGQPYCITCSRGYPEEGWPCPTVAAMRRTRESTEVYFLG